jgi:hypothetical protein
VRRIAAAAPCLPARTWPARNCVVPVPYTTMIKLPAGASPSGGFVRVTICPRRVCLPSTLNPSLTSSSRALIKGMPTTSGTGTRSGVLESWGVDEGLAGAVDEGLAVRDAGKEAAEDGTVELAGDAKWEAAGAAAAGSCGFAAAEFDQDAGPAAADGAAAAEWPAGEVVMAPLAAGA